MAIVEWLVPVAGMMMAASIIWVIVWYKVKKAQYARPDADFRRLAETALENQRALTSEVKGLNEAVEEIRRLLSAV